MPEPSASLLLSACLGALIGLIRQWEVQQDSRPDSGFAGLRTFTVFSMLGWVAAFATKQYAPWAFAVTLGVFGGLLAVGQFRRPGDHPTGYTTSGAALLTFFSGALVQWGERQPALLLAAVTMILIGLKQPIHQWTRSLTLRDVRTVLQFVAITGVILPLVPNRTFGPFGAFNPWSTWLMVVLISGMGFLGYLLSRLLGSQAGIALTGMVGGLASSTATTLTFSRRSREEPSVSAECALAIVLACTVMLARVVVIVATLHAGLAQRIVLPLMVMAVPGMGFAAWMWLGRRERGETVPTPAVSNPLQLPIAIQFALIYSGVKFLVKAAAEWKLAEGILVISAVAGLTDVDAVTLSMADGVREGTLESRLAVSATVIACLANTLGKAGIAVALGSAALRRWVVAVLGATLLAGAAALAWIPA